MINRTICSHGNDTFNPCGRVPLALPALSGYYKGSDEGLPRALLRVWQKWWPQHKDTGLTRTARNKPGKVNSIQKHLNRSKIWAFETKRFKNLSQNCQECVKEYVYSSLVYYLDQKLIITIRKGRYPWRASKGKGKSNCYLSPTTNFNLKFI